MKKILSFGEVLWDIFPDRATVGGAPFLFSAHAAALGNEVCLLTGIGNDTLGDDTLRAIVKQGISTAFVQRNNKKTATTTVKINGNDISYDIASDTAYDAITSPKDEDIASLNADVLYFGTVCQRSDISRASLHRLVERHHFPVIFCDINCRAGQTTDDSILYCLRHAAIIKINRDEYAYLQKLGALSAADYGAGIKELTVNFPNLTTVLLTLDADGAMCYTKDTDTVTAIEALPVKVVSAVGAGDSYAAAFLSAILQGKDTLTALTEARALASHMISVAESVPPAKN